MTIDLDFDTHHLWHPYTSMINPLPCHGVKSASGVYLTLESGETVIDAMASWWSVIHGHNVPEVTEAVIQQVQTMSHVMFGGLTHEPAIELGKKLVDLTPERLQKVFLADSGSVAVEVALKMAIQYWAGKGKPEKSRMVTVNHGYHGDTFGAMSVCDPVNGMHSLFESVLPKSLFLGEIPQGIDTEIDPALAESFENQIKQHAHELAAFIIEPVVQGTGGMRFYNPAWLTLFRNLCDKYNILLIFDEIATGFGRTGQMFALQHADTTPDILCLGKALSAGYMTLAATVATEDVALHVSKSDAGVFMHGPTFMGNPLACAAANASLTLLIEKDWQQDIQAIEQLLLDSLSPLKQEESVNDVRVLGAIGVVEMKNAINVASAQAFFVNQGVWVRPFGKLLYIMPPYSISQTELTIVTQAISLYVQNLSSARISTGA